MNRGRRLGFARSRAPLFALSLALMLVATPFRALAAPARSLAVLVGANAPAPGREPLRFALGDARLMADTLAQTGRFAKDDIVTLLEPSPRQLLAALERVSALAGEADAPGLFVFYYSGHSDGQQLFPGGEALPLAELRGVIGRLPARVRVAILDTCRGGAWTNTKGLSVGPPLRSVDLLDADTAGTALLSSSSGLENAHEAAIYGGSFFTHHVAAGLLGAADASGDGNVTLQEVFSYAKDRTVRDSAHLAPTTQHPSFEIELRGRQDVVLSELAQSPSVLELTQRHAHEVVHLSSGVTALETLPSQRLVRLALPAGQYVVRRVVDGRVLSKDVSVPPGASVRVDESELVPADERLASKGGGAAFDPPGAHDTLPASTWELRLGLGVTTGRVRDFGAPLFSTTAAEAPPLTRELAAVGSFTYAISDRLEWSVPLPAFAYRFGTEGELTAIARAGMTAFGYSSIDGVLGAVDAGVGVRGWLGPGISLLGAISSDWAFGNEQRERVLALHGNVGLIWNVTDRVTVAVGAGYTGGVALFDPTLDGLAGVTYTLQDPVADGIVIGALQSLGYRPLPLLQLYLTQSLALDAYATWLINLETGDVRDRVLGGFTWTF
jgi:caspase domain-containing protein